jgi:hypothetical protein
MRKTLVTAIAAAAILTAGMHVKRVDAMSLALPSQLGVAAAHAAIVRQAAVVCGNNGCGPVQTQRVQRRRHP